MEDSAVFAIVNGRVHTRHLEDDEAQSAEYPLVVLSFRTGIRQYNPVVSYPVFEVWTYSRLSQGDATDLYDTVAEALQAERFLLYDKAGTRTGSSIVSETQQGTEGFNPQTRAWFTQSRWLARTIS